MDNTLWNTEYIAYLGLVRNKEKTGLDFLIDKITNSIENAVTGDSFQTEVSILSNADFKTISEKKLWLFDWKTEHRNPKTEVFKLTINIILKSFKD